MEAAAAAASGRKVEHAERHTHLDTTAAATRDDEHGRAQACVTVMPPPPLLKAAAVSQQEIADASGVAVVEQEAAAARVQAVRRGQLARRMVTVKQELRAAVVSPAVMERAVRRRADEVEAAAVAAERAVAAALSTYAHALRKAETERPRRRGCGHIGGGSDSGGGRVADVVGDGM